MFVKRPCIQKDSDTLQLKLILTNDKYLFDNQAVNEMKIYQDSQMSSLMKQDF